MISKSRKYVLLASLSTLLLATGSRVQAQSGWITEWTSPSLAPGGGTSEPLFAKALTDEQIFFSERLAGKIGRLNPESNTIAEWTVFGFPHDFIFGQGGVLFANQSGYIGKLMPGANQLTIWSVGGIPEHLELPGNLIYFTDGAGAIGRLNSSTGALRTWAIPGADAANGIDVAAGGRYVAFLGTAAVGILDTTTNTFRQWPQPGNPGTNGHLRFAGRYLFFGSNAVTTLNRLDPFTNRIRSWTLPNPSGIGDILIDGEDDEVEDVRVKLTETIGKIAVFDAGTPGVDSTATPAVNVVLPADSLITPVTIPVTRTEQTVIPTRTPVPAVRTGGFVEWAVPTPGSLLGGISPYEDDALLFAERNGNKIGILSGR